jgi:diguanylate cyclase (GGDEF)-like protein
MDADLFTRKPGSEVRLGTKLFVAAALSYLIDGALLAGFAAAGVIDRWVAFAYTGTGLTVCLMFYRLSAIAPLKSGRGHFFPLLQVTLSSALQFAFVALAPNAAFYFLVSLFTVFGFGSLGLSRRQSVFAWFGVVLSVAAVTTVLDISITLPQATFFQRFLLWLCFVATLGRCILLGDLGRSLRLHLLERRRQLRISVEMLEERDRSLARVNLELKRQATHDALTGIANRVLFVERLEQAIHEGKTFGVCVLDLDRFKEINDSLGHAAGDALLQSVAQRLLSIMHASDTVARAGGDEFLMLFRDVHSAREAEARVTDCMQILAERHRLAHTDLHVSSSIGIAMYPEHAGAAEDLLTHADEAMYCAKRSGRHTFRFYDERSEGFSRGNLRITDDTGASLPVAASFGRSKIR